MQQQQCIDLQDQLNSFLHTVHVVRNCRSPNPCLPQQQDTIPYAVKSISLALLKMGKVCPKHVELILEINKLLLLHLIGFLYYFTYTDDARSNTNHCFTVLKFCTLVMHWMNNVKVTNAQQARIIHYYKNTKEKLFNCSSNRFTCTRNWLLLWVMLCKVRNLYYQGFDPLFS